MNISMARFSFAALAATWSVGALAQSSEEEELALAYGDQSTISIATGGKQALSRAPSVASVITAEDIAAMGVKDLDQVMESVPGVHVSHTSNFYSPTYVFRGSYNGQANP